MHMMHTRHTLTQGTAMLERRVGRRGAIPSGAMRPDEAPRGRDHGDHGERGDHGDHGERPAGAETHGRRGGRGGDHGGRGARGGRGEGPRVGKGDVRAATILLLAEQPLHGYQIIHLIEERSGGLWRPSAGSVYPALQLLEDEGLIQVEPVEGRRVFHLTEAGRAYVEERRDELTTARDAVSATVGAGWAERRAHLHQVDTALTQVAQVGTPAQLAAARDLLVTTRRQLYRILADDAAPTDADAARP